MTDTDTKDADPPISSFYMLGMNLDWNSPRVPVQLFVELPFWLLVPDGRIDVTVNGCPMGVHILNDGVEIQVGAIFSRAHTNVVFLGPRAEIENYSLPVSRVLNGGVAHPTRTVLILSTTAHADALAAYSDTGPRCNEGHLYFQSLAFGHIAFVNHVINTYRHLTFDPFVAEVSEFDVPVWLVAIGNKLCPVHLFRYAVFDRLPSARNIVKEKEDRPRHTTSLGDLDVAAKLPRLPGEVELLDAWSLCYRGRYRDSIRALVTSIEVLLEHKLTEVLKKRIADDVALKAELSRTDNKFWERLDQYCDEVQRRIPGPMIHFIWYLNGVRLRDELMNTRSLRNTIVHQGERLDHTLVNLMRRATETTTWLFDWLAGDGGIGERQMRHYGYYEALRAQPRFDFEIKSDGVAVLPMHGPKPGESAAEASDNRLDAVPTEKDDVIESVDLSRLPISWLHKALGSGGRPVDLELFAAMALASTRLKVEDSPPPRRDRAAVSDRYRLMFDGATALVFLCDTHSTIAGHQIEQIAETVEARRKEGVHVCGGIVIANEHNGIPWTKRPRPSPTDASHVEAARRGIAIIEAGDLARLITGLRKYNWDERAAFAKLVAPGRGLCDPPGCNVVGITRHFYSTNSVVSIELVPGASIRVGDILVFRLQTGFHQELVSSLQQDRVPVSRATSGRVGVSISLSRNEIRMDEEVFIVLHTDDDSDESAEI